MTKFTPIIFSQNSNINSPLRYTTLILASVLGLAGQSIAQDKSREEISAARKKREAVMNKRHNMRNKKARAEAVRQMKEAEAEFRAAVEKRAKAKGLKIQGKSPNGRGFRLVDFDENDQPVYIQEENINAAISTAANEVRSNSTYNNVTGSGMTIGLWEATGVPRLTHQEFGGRVTVLDGTTSVSGHATHVAGTLIASGVNPSLLGMAPEADIIAFTSGNEISEMTANGAAEADSDDLYLSNHSYGVGQGWENSSGTWRYLGTFSDDGDSSNDFERDFGRYASSSVNWDRVAYSLPYYLIFVSSGNQRSNNPSEGDTWERGTITYTYDSAIHPLGDGEYKDGWDNMEGRKLAKNVMTVGNAADAVNNGVRDVSRAVTVASSSRGPADDGRIKPDITANGRSLLSADDNSDTATATLTGTSMATPNACGSAALLVDYYSSRFPNEAMRASTLKGLILHTADDDGNPGPDYRYGWGIMNTKVAADVIALHADDNGGATLIEESVDTQTESRSHTFLWDGNSPLRVTLCWTDPEGTQKVNHEDREKALVNDLNLKVIGPDGTHLPYVMPHVGDWSVGSIDDDAVTGVNDVDPVEQVYLASPTAGAYEVIVDYAGSLTDNEQDYSLVITGQSRVELTALEIWHLDNFGTETDSGNGANDADYDRDGLTNLLEYGLGTSPTEPNVLPVTISRDGSEINVNYPRNIEAMNDFNFEVIWSDDLTTGSWNTTNISEEITSDDGVLQQVVATDTSTTDEDKRFYRVRMTQK